MQSGDNGRINQRNKPLTLSELQEVLQAKKMAAHKRRKARILLKVDQGAEGPGWTDDQAAAAFDCRRQTVERLRQRVVERGFECILKHGNIGAYRAKALDGVAEAHTIALACGDAPEGRNRWTVRLLADKLIELQVVDSCSKSSVHRTLKKMNLSLT